MQTNTPAKKLERVVRFELSQSSSDPCFGVIMTPRACIRVPVRTARSLQLRTLIANVRDSHLPTSPKQREHQMHLIRLANSQIANNRLSIGEGCKTIAKMTKLLSEMQTRTQQLTAYNQELERVQRENLNQNNRMQSQQNQLNKILNDANLHTIHRRKKITAFDYDCIPDMELLRKYRVQLKQSSRNHLKTYDSIIAAIRNFDAQIIELTNIYEQRKVKMDLMKRKVEEQNARQKQYEFNNQVLQMQLNPYFLFGFSSQMPCLDETDLLRLFAKMLKAWNKKEQKVLSPAALRRYVLLQLYPAWEQLLNALPYTYSGYRELFCDLSPVNALQKQTLLTLVHTRAAKTYRIPERNFMNVIVYSYSDDAFQLWLKTFQTEIQNSKNCLLQILRVNLESGGKSKTKKTETDSWTITIQYQAKWAEGTLRKVINLQLLKDLSYQAIVDAMNRKQGHCLVVQILFQTLCEEKTHEQLKKVLKTLKKYR